MNNVTDLSHPIENGMPLWPGDPETRLQSAASYDVDGYYLNTLFIGEHTGTHIGAPVHFVKNGSDMCSIPPEKLILRTCKISIKEKTDQNPGYLLSIQDIQEWEDKNGTIDAELLLIETGWSRYWKQAKYLGIENEQLTFPGVSYSAAKWLLNKYSFAGMGIDSAGLDGGADSSYKTNLLLASAGLFHLENLANLDKLKNKNITVFIGALPVTSGSGSPCRVLAI